MSTGHGAYTFGDSPLAARRLELLASVFEPATRSLLRSVDLPVSGLVVDLGCGPGHTSRLLADVLAPPQLIAIDSSPSFVEQARGRLGRRAQVLLGDVLALPEPVRDASVTFARFLVTHLAEPEAAVGHWLDRLAPGGVLLLEEVDAIVTEEPVLAAYLELQRRMLAANGQRLEAGPVAETATRGAAVTSQVAELTPATDQAAQLFAMNFAGWRERPGVSDLATADELHRIADGLAEVAGGAPARSITWHMRQVIASRR